MYNLEIEKKQRHKLIIIAISMVIVIVLLIVAIVAVATGKSGKKSIGGTGNGEFAIVSEDAESTEKTEAKTEQETKETEAKTEDTKSATVGAISTKTVETTTVTSTSKSLPDTGPADLLPLAATLGLMTAGATALVMKKREF